MVTINLKVSKCRDIIANGNIIKSYVVNPCDSCNTDVNTPLIAIHVHVTQYSSTVYVGIAMVYPIKNHITQYGSTVYIGIAMVYPH